MRASRLSGDSSSCRFSAPPSAEGQMPYGSSPTEIVVVDRVAAIARGSGRTLEVVGRVKTGPPICAALYKIRTPDLIRDVPLRGLRKIVIAYFLEIPLLPFASVNEGKFLFGEVRQRIWFGKSGKTASGCSLRQPRWPFVFSSSAHRCAGDTFTG